MKRLLVLFAAILASCGGGDFTDSTSVGPTVTNDAAVGSDVTISPVEAGSDHVVVPDAVIPPDVLPQIEAGTDALVEAGPETGTPDSPAVDAPATDSNACKGCFQGSTCRTGDQPQACGIGGTACTVCAALNECDAPYCDSTGTCRHDAPTKDGMLCSVGMCSEGKCVDFSAGCGKNGQVCCTGGTCDPAVGCAGSSPPCDVGGTQPGTALACVKGQFCKLCGHKDEPCCGGPTPPDYVPNSKCSFGLNCYDDICNCGGRGQSCCLDTSKNPTLCNSTADTCINGTCYPA